MVAVREDEVTKGRMQTEVEGSCRDYEQDAQGDVMQFVG